jgi:integrase
MTLDNISQGDFYQWIDWLESEKYAQSTIDKFVVRFKFILNRAVDEGLDASPVRSQKIYVDNDDEVEGVSLSEEEIQSILDKDFSFDPKLQITKHNFVVGIFTGLRFSDYGKHLNKNILADGFIELRTQKTKTKVVIPLHPELEKVLKFYHGEFPPKQTSNLFNENLKTICQLCDIDEMTEGKVFDSEIKRKVHGDYEKYKLVTSHTLRRSFVTIHKVVIDEKTLCDILGWSSATMLKIYDMTTKKDSAKKLKDVWEKKTSVPYRKLKSVIK